MRHPVLAIASVFFASIAFAEAPKSNKVCQEYSPMNGATGTLLSVKKNPGYTDDGSLLWPNGQVFLKRNAGYTDDRSLFYPNGNLLLRRNTGYTNDRELYWPNQKILVRANKGYTNHGEAYRPNGNVWFRRNEGYTNDRQFAGGPVARSKTARLKVSARFSGGDRPRVTVVKPVGAGKIVVIVGTDLSVRVKECTEPPESDEDF